MNHNTIMATPWVNDSHVFSPERALHKYSEESSENKFLIIQYLLIRF
jgi:hypothetical protein